MWSRWLGKRCLAWRGGDETTVSDGLYIESIVKPCKTDFADQIRKNQKKVDGDDLGKRVFGQKNTHIVFASLDSACHHESSRR